MGIHPMAQSNVADALNTRVAQAMRVFHINARDAILQVANASDGLRLVDQTDPADTDSREVRLYAQLDSPLCVNAWLVSPNADATSITDPDVFLRAGIGFDTQELDWGWHVDDRPDYIDDEGREWL
jgi:hypothetical protein